MTDVPTRADMSDELDAFRFPPLPTGLTERAPGCDGLAVDQDQVVADSRWLTRHKHSREQNLDMPPALRPHKTACYSDGLMGGHLTCIGAPRCKANRDTH